MKNLQCIRPKQAAELLSVGVATLWRWAHRPDFPKARKVGARTTLFVVDELVAWRDAQMCKREA